MRTQRRRIRLRPSRQNTIANNLLPPARSGRATTAACDTLSCRTSAASISPGSIRKPRTLTCWSTRPTNSKTPPARQVPAAVHPPSRSTIPIRNKTLPRQPAATNISPPNPGPRNVKLPNNPNRHRLQTTIQYINSQIGDAAPDEISAGREGNVPVEQNMTDMHRRLGDAVHVDQHGGTVDVMLIPIFKSPHSQRFTTKDHMPQNKRSSELRMLPLRLHQLIECRRCLVENGDAFVRKQRQKLFGRAADRVGNDDQSTAMEKWTPNLPHGEIEGERME